MKIKHFKLNQFRINLISGFLAYGINALVILISYPIYIKYLGYELLGLWSTFAIIISLGQIGNIGISETMMKFLAEESYQLHDNKRIYSIITNGLFLITISSTLLFVVFFLLRNWIILFLNITPEFQDIAKRIILFIILLSFQQILISFIKGVLAGLNRLDLSNIIFTVGNILRILAILIFFLLGLKIWAMVWGNILVSTINILVFYYVVKKRVGSNFIHLNLLNKKELRNVVKYGSGLLGSNILSYAFIPVFKALIARYVGLKEVAYFEISWKAIYQIRGLIQKSLLAFLPHISELNKHKQYNEMFFLIKKSTRYSILFSSAMIIGMLLFAPFIIDLWLGKNSEDIITLSMRILTIGLAGGLIVVPIHYAFLGIGKVSLIFYSELIKSSFTVVALVVLAEMQLLDYSSILILVVFGILLSSVYLFINYLRIKKSLTSLISAQ